MPSASTPRLPIVISRFAGGGRPVAARAGDSSRARTALHAGVPLSLVADRADPDAARGGPAPAHRWSPSAAATARSITPSTRSRTRRSRWRRCPAGTGNDFCRSLGLAPTLEPALKAIASGAIASGRRARGQRRASGHRRGARRGRRPARSRWAGWPGAAMSRGRSSGPSARSPTSARPAPGSCSSRRWRVTRPCAGVPAPDADWQQVDGRYYGIFLACRPTLGAGLRLPLTWTPTMASSKSCWWNEARGCRWRSTCRGCAAAAPVPHDMLSIHHAAAADIEWPDGTAIIGDGEDLGEATTIEARLLPQALRVVTAERRRRQKADEV